MRANPVSFATLFSLCFALSSTSRAAPAEDAAAPVDTHSNDLHQELSLNVGFDSLLGLGGLAYSMTPLPWLRVEGGVGYGATGAQLALMAKWIFFRGGATDVQVGLGPALALKPLDPTDADSELHKTGVATWLNAELGIEHRIADSRVVFIFAGGLSLGLSGNYLLDRAISGNTFGVAGSLMPGMRLGLGYAF